ncbi:MAG: hypothetical protein H7141_09320 [Burkholderiales bacterium]|nr:hypothetical protein [Bacteroidia bacterium]
MEIIINKPCHENWENMTLNETGAFCGKCVKTVIDFSGKSLDEVKNFFENKQHSKVCGRFEKQQLVSLSFDAYFKEFKVLTFNRRFAVILYFTFGMWLFGTSSAVSQTKEHFKGDVEVKHNPIMGGVRATAIPSDTLKVYQKPKPNTKIVKGKVEVKQQDVKEMKMGKVKAEPPKTKVTDTKKSIIK